MKHSIKCENCVNFAYISIYNTSYDGDYIRCSLSKQSFKYSDEDNSYQNALNQLFDRCPYHMDISWRFNCDD